MTGSVETLAMRLLDGFDKHVSSGILLSRSRDKQDRELSRYNPSGFTGLHWTAYLGFMEIAATLLDMKKWDPDTRDVRGNTALSWASRKGHRDIVKMLLERVVLFTSRLVAPLGSRARA